METLTFHHTPLLTFPASSLADNFKICILAHMFGGSIGSATMNYLLSAL